MNGHIGSYSKSFKDRASALKLFERLNEGYMQTGVVGAVMLDKGRVAKKVGYYL